jgi:serine protease Do
MPMRRILASAWAVALVSSACTAGEPRSATPSASAATAGPTTVASAVVSPVPSGDDLLVRSIETLPGAVVQIESSGTFRDPVEGRETIVGRGSGFLVDPSGVVVTNNHVVTGADSVTVWVGPTRAKHEARVLGASECSDLAVVRIDGGPFPWLDWYRGDIEPGLDIYAAGYPLGDPEYTLSKGIVSRAHGIIDEYWASVTNSIEHDANINPGSSGGPVVTTGGQVVAVDYAGDKDTRQSFAISRDEALPILSELEDGRDVTSLGINGTAYGPDEPDVAPQGIWASSVKPGSPAARAGIRAGDSVTRLAGTRLGTEGTMQEYCDALRTHQPADRIPFTVFRADTFETLDGEINGAPIMPGFAFATALGSGPPDDLASFRFDQVSFGHDTLTFETPEAWADQVDQPWKVGSVEVGQGGLVSPDIDAFKHGWKTPGAYVGVAMTVPSTLTITSVLDTDRPKFEKSCTYAGRKAFSRGGFAGRYDLWQDCGGSDSRFLTIAGQPADRSQMIYLQFQATDNDDLVVLDRVLATLEAG